MGLEVGKWPTARVQNVNVSFLPMRWSQAEALNRAPLRTHYNPILMLWSGIQAKVTGHYRAVFYLREPTLLQTRMIYYQSLQKIYRNS